MARSVVLLHSVPDGESHFDWMVEQDEVGDERRLLTWRCDARPDQTGWSGRADQIEAHRAAYLDYEGEISSGRGSVHRVANGRVIHMQSGVDSMDLAIQWADAVIQYRGKPVGDDGCWLFSVV